MNRDIARAVQALRTYDHESAPDWADAAEDEVKKIETKARDFRNALDSIGSLSGRCSAGHDADCPCGYCLIKRMTLSALKNE